MHSTMLVNTHFYYYYELFILGQGYLNKPVMLFTSSVIIHIVILNVIEKKSKSKLLWPK